VKLDATVLRYLDSMDFRVLSAIEQLSKNHDLVPTAMIPRIANIKASGARGAIATLHKHKLVYHESKAYDGYRLTYAGYDFLALKALNKSEQLASVAAARIGCGKESDIFTGQTPAGDTVIVKVHRLGRTSFRSVKINRDYHEHRKHASWLYLSRLAALKEYAFMKVLYDAGFPCPRPIYVNRHMVVMELVDAQPLGKVKQLPDAGATYAACIELILRLAAHGLIHCDFNEFNLLMDADQNLIVIDFPQVVSVDHLNAEYYFDRDVECIHSFFKKRHRFDGEKPSFKHDVQRVGEGLDVAARASGFDASKNEELVQFFSSLPVEEPGARDVEAQADSDDEDDADDDDADNDDEVDDDDDDDGGGDDGGGDDDGDVGATVSGGDDV
jgi:RIO kinase 2